MEIETERLVCSDGGSPCQISRSLPISVLSVDPDTPLLPNFSCSLITPTVMFAQYDKWDLRGWKGRIMQNAKGYEDVLWWIACNCTGFEVLTWLWSILSPRMWHDVPWKMRIGVSDEPADYVRNRFICPYDGSALNTLHVHAGMRSFILIQ